jgi:O-antigen/teichoic acid export membrane protein/glycosyltransferase involved in cell wall biosynthesis
LTRFPPATLRGRRFAGGTLSLIASRTTSGLATLVATPILFSRLGPAAFGLWTVLLGAAGIATYADAGLGSTLLRETAGAHTGAAALRRAQGALGLALVVPTVMGATLAGGILLAWPAIASGLDLGALGAPARVAALLLVAGVVVDGWGTAGRAALEGTGRIPWSAGITAATAALTALLGVLAVLDARGLPGLGAAVLIGAVLRASLLTLVARRAEPRLTPRLRALRSGELKSLIRYGGAVQASQAGGALNAESDRLVISGVAGVASAGALDVGLRLVNLIGLVPFCLLYSLFPAFARLAAQGDRRGLDAIYVRASRRVATASLVPTALLAACAPSVIVLWLGRPVPFAAACLLALCPAVGIGSLTGVASAICRAEGAPGRETRFVMTTAALNVVLTLALAVAVGPIGVAVATSLATVLGAVGFLASFHRATGRPGRLLREALGAPVAAGFAAVGGAFAAGLLVPVGADRQHAALAVAVRGLAGLAAAAAALWARSFAQRLRRPATGTVRDSAAEHEWAIYLSAIGWEGRRNRQQELALQLTNSRRVLFVEPPGLGIAWRLQIDVLGESLWRVQPLALLPLGRFLPWVNRVNRRYSGRRLRDWLDRRPGDRVVILDEDLAAPLAARLAARARVYDAADLDWTFTRRWNRRHLRAALAEAVGAADLVLTSSTTLAEHLPPARGPVVELLNACDAEHFERDVRVPASVEALPRPRIGYVGVIDARAFDCRLVATVASNRPEWTFVLAGPIDARVASGLAARSNVHLLGPVSYEDLPGVVSGFDVCMIPYRVGERIDYVQPKKLFEYFAAGKPVVATALPALSRLDGPCHLAPNADAFGAAIATALDECDSTAVESRRRCAREHTWELRGRTLRTLLDEVRAVGV